MIESLSKEPFKEKIELKFRSEDNVIVVKDVLIIQGFYDANKNRTKFDQQKVL